VASRIPSLGPRGEGWFALQIASFWLLVAAIVTAPPGAAEDPADTGTRHLLGYLIGIVGATLIGSGISALRQVRAMTVLPHPRADAQLVESGAFRLVRHPIYGGLVLGAVGLAVITPWWGTFAAVGLLAVVLDLKRRREELWLTDRYPGYGTYRARTKALIPFIY
jgi:protein-S-isoprenylcysteine O-methyltransferase Ste14